MAVKISLAQLLYNGVCVARFGLWRTHAKTQLVKVVARWHCGKLCQTLLYGGLDTEELLPEFAGKIECCCRGHLVYLLHCFFDFTFYTGNKYTLYPYTQQFFA